MIMSTSRTAVRWAAGTVSSSRRLLLAAAALVVLSACHSDDPAAPGRLDFEASYAESLDPRSQPQPLGMGATGTFHKAVMDDLVANLDEWLPDEGSREQRVCTAALRLMRKHIGLFDAERGVQRSAGQLEAMAVKSISLHPMCRSPRSMSIIGNVSMLRSSVMTTDSLVSDEFIPYTDAIAAGVAASSGTTSAVTSVVNSVMATTGGLSYADYKVVESVGDLAISSAIQWNGQDWGPSGDYCEEDVHPWCIMTLHSIVGIPQGWIRKTLVALGTDVLGGATMAAANWYVAGMGPVGWALLTGEVAIVGAGTSAITALGFLA